MDLFVGANTPNDVRGELSVAVAVAEQAGGSQHRLGFPEPDLGAEFDDQHVRDERQELFHPGGDLGQVAVVVFASETGLRFDVIMCVGSERQVTCREPHLVVATDALVRNAALVDAVRFEQAATEVTDRHLRDVLDDLGLQVRHRDQGDERAACFDLADDGQHVPEHVGDPVAQQHDVLRRVRHACAAEQRRRCREGFPTAPAKCGLPGIECLHAAQCPRRMVGPVGEEAAVERAAGDDVGLCVVVRGQQLVSGEGELRTVDHRHRLSLLVRPPTRRALRATLGP